MSSSEVEEGISKRKAKKALKIQSIKKSREVFQSVDGQVQHTNDDSVVSKRSAVIHGYMNDPFLRYFVKSKTRRSPLINRGYYLRMRTITDLVLSTIDTISTIFQPSGPIQVLSLGAGYDTLAMRCLLTGKRTSFYEKHTFFFDVDFPAVMRSKSLLLRGAEESVFPASWNVAPDSPKKVYIEAPNYAAVGVDLREAEKDLIPSLCEGSSCFSCQNYTIIYAECVFQYLPPEASTSLLAHLAQSFPNAVFFGYDQMHDEDSFGKVMDQSLKSRNSPLLGVCAYGDAARMTQRALQCGMRDARFANFYDLGRYYFHPQEKKRLDALEPFDEEEEWSEMCEHYGITMCRTLESFPSDWHPCFKGFSEFRKNSQSAAIKSYLQPWPSGRFRFERWGFGAMHSFECFDGDIIFISFGGFCASKNHGRVNSVCCHSLRRGDLNVVMTTDLTPGKLIFHSFSKLSATQYIVFGGRTNPKEVSDATFLLTLNGLEDSEAVISARWDALHADRMSEHPCARFRHVATACGNNSVFVFGGRDGTGAFLGDSWMGKVALDENRIVWSRMHLTGDVPAPCGSAAAVFYNNQIVVTGGLFENFRASGSLTLINAGTGECVRRDQKIGERFSHSMSVISYRGKTFFFVLGGSVCNPKDEVELAVLIDSDDMSAAVQPVQLPASSFWWSRHAVIPLSSGVVAVVGGGYTCFSFGTASVRPLVLILEGGDISFSSRSVAATGEPFLLRTSKNALEGACLTQEFFEHISVRAESPVLFRNVDFGPCLTKWKDPVYVSHAEQNTTVSVHVAKDSELDFVHKNFAFRHVSFQEMVDAVVNCTSWFRENGTFPPETFYYRSIASHMKTERANFWKDFPSLGKDFHLPAEVEPHVMPRLHQACLRLNPSPLTLWMHYDTLDNVLCQVVGTKKVTLFPPSQYNNLYMVDSSSRVLNVAKPNVERFPKFLEACKHRVDVILNPGDMILIPALWFHHIETVESSDPYSISVNVFYDHFSREMYDKKDLYGNKDVPVYSSLRTKIVEQVTNLVKEQEKLDLPSYSNLKYTAFALREAIQDLESLAASLDARNKI